MRRAIDDLLAQAPVSRAAVDAFLDRHDFPLVEGRQATFVYRGDAEAVRLRHWIYGLPTAQPFHRVPGTDLWYFLLDLPPGSRVEYKLEIERGDHNEWICDPLNPTLAHDPFGANSVCQATGYVRPLWSEPRADARRGTLEELELTDTPFGDTRRVSVYLPARFRPTRRYQLLIVHDGGDYLEFASLLTVLDNLIDDLEVAPLIVALTYPDERLVEYPNYEPHCRFLSEQLVPTLEARYPLITTPGARGLMGASFGAVASLATAWRYPGRFGNLLLQSGSFAFTDIGTHNRGPAFDPVVEFVNAFRQAPGRPAEHVFVSCGAYESLIYENRTMVPLLQSTGMSVRYAEAPDGHNWENWRDRLRVALSWLFPGPLWMVYE
ncbi:alpha/beta hydrolase-fold protein [Haliangium sp.]|uniref:alpha/beta hydrolase-fold protein n=1 Tax=Haliangium sp. TaxID=2663208 RepID=UPI003D0FC254